MDFSSRVKISTFLIMKIDGRADESAVLSIRFQISLDRSSLFNLSSQHITVKT